MSKEETNLEKIGKVLKNEGGKMDFPTRWSDGGTKYVIFFKEDEIRVGLLYSGIPSFESVPMSEEQATYFLSRIKVRA